MVLIFSMRFDYSTNCVMKWLDYKGFKVIRINGEDDFYKFVQITKEGIIFRDSVSNKEVNLRDVKSCWWRRTGLTKRHFAATVAKEQLISNDVDISRFINDKRNFIDDEAKDLIDYICYTVYNKASINLGNPQFNLNRLIVLDIAKKYGLMVPEYMIVQDGRQLEMCRNNFAKAVTKAVSNGIYRDIYNHRFYTYTELIEEDFYEKNREVDFFPSMVSDLIEKKIEIRSFYLDGEFYSMAIFSQSDEKTKIDFRKYTNNRREPFRLPKHIELKLKYIFRELDLNCGSADLIIDSNDNYIFLEINPVGQFAMTSEPCNYDLHKKVANFLAYGTTN